MGRTRIVSAVAAATIGGVALVGVGAPAHAATGGGWTTISTGGGLSIITQPDTLRLPAAQGNRLLVGWSASQGLNADVRTRQVTTSGKVSGPVATVVDDWVSLDQRVALARSNGKVVIAFQGMRTATYGDKYGGNVVYATSSTGSSWSLASGSLSRSASGGYALDLVDNRGTLVSAFTAASDDRLRFHNGVDALPATRADGATTARSGNAYDGALARDPKTGEVWAAWFQGSTSSSSNGIWVQRILPSAGRAYRAPGSSNLVDPLQTLALTPRSTGGVYLAYAVGYPTTKAVRLWKVGSSKYAQVTAKTARDVSASAAPGGRIWVSWATGYTGAKATVKAARTSTSATRFGPVVKSKAIHGPTIWTTKVEGSRGAADVVVTADTSSSGRTVGIYETQLKPALSAKLSRSSVHKAKGGKVTVTVTDAGQRVKGAKVRYGGKSHTTNATGQASFTVAKKTSTGKKAVTVSRTGYTGKKLVLKVVR